MNPSEQCDHIRCLPPYRQEYCEIAGKELDGEITCTVDTIMDVLYDFSNMRVDSRTLFTSEDNTYSRVFDVLVDEPNSTASTREDVSICHQRNKQPNHQRFIVSHGWIVMHPDAPERSYITTYTIEIWPGLAQATIGEYDIRPHAAIAAPSLLPSVQDRPMTPYDHRVLRDVLLYVSETSDTTAGES